MADWVVEPYHRSRHQRELFSCGKPALDDFLHQRVTQYEKRKLGRTYVATRPNDNRVLGYYTIASSSVAFAQLPASAAHKLPAHPVPVILLARLAVDASIQGQGLGAWLLADALRRSLELSETLGVHAVEVEAIDPDARRFYMKFGFAPLTDQELHLYLPMATIATGFANQ